MLRLRLRQSTLRRRAEDDFEVHLAGVADSVSGAAVLALVGVGPGLVQVAVVERAFLGRALGLGGVDGHSDVGRDAVHDGDVVGGAFEAVVRAVAEFEESLGFPDAGEAPFGVAGEAHADALVGGGDGVGLVLADGDGVADLERLEGRGDFVDAELLAGVAVVDDLDVEGVVTLDGSGCCHQGEQGADEEACGVHFCSNDCSRVAFGGKSVGGGLPCVERRTIDSKE
jgi:hypothetical protein